MATDTNNRRSGRGVVGVLAAIVGIVLAWYGTDLPERFCESRFVPVICDDRMRPVAAEEAAVFIDSFLGRAGASTPRNAWLLMSPEAQAETPVEVFEEMWMDIDWAERLGAIEPAARNSFVVRYRSYEGAQPGSYSAGKGTVTTSKATFALQRVETVQPGPELALEIAHFGPPARDEILLDTPFAAARIVAPVTARERPREDAQATGEQGRQRLDAYCVLQAPGPGGALWARTGVGWVLIDDVSVNLEGEPRACDDHHATAP